MKIDISQAVILCGGEGTRLGSITKKTPKPLIKINGKSFIDYQINFLKKFGFKSFILLCGYKAHKFIKKYKNNKNIKIIIENEKMNTGGALLNSIEKLDKNFLFYNGDTFADFNFEHFIDDLRNKRQKNSIAVKSENLPNRYGKVKINYLKKKVVKIDKKLKSNLIFSGFALLNKNSLRKIKIEKKTFEELILNKLISKNILTSFQLSKNINFVDIGVKSDLKNCSKILHKSKNRKVVFFDRDGTINKDIKYLYRKEDFIWNKSFFKTLDFLNSKNILVIIITNQSGIGRGFYTEKDVIQLHKWMNNFLIQKNNYIDDFFYAPFFKNSKENIYKKKSNFRKPNIGMVTAAKKKWELNLKKAIIIGDSMSDEQLAKKLNVKFIKVNYKSNLFIKIKNII